jgi:5-methylcytosine-specific restriction protein A
VTAGVEVDHILPVHKGGTDEDDNLQALCHECHESKTRTDLGQRDRPATGLDGWPVTHTGGGRNL